jgi:hypothetical protein
MKNRLSLLALGLLGILVLTPSCGADEGTSDDGGEAGDDSGTTCTDDRQCREGRLCADVEGGDRDGYCEPDLGETCECVEVGSGGGSSGGSSAGGSGNRGGSAGAVITGGSSTGGSSTGGSSTGGTGGSTVMSALGSACTEDADCGEGLVCLLSDGLPSGDGPPNGLCSVTCDSDDQCLEFANEAYCVGFEETTDMMSINYCILACTGGTPGAPKCKTRDDFACGILDTTATTQACASTDDCGAGQVCFAEIEGNPTVCHNMLTACRPVCRADADCAADQFCNFATGFCTATEPPGLPIGSLCDPTLPPEQDECNGFCLATDETETEGTCSAFCSFGLDLYGCGWVGEGAPDAGCLFATVVSRDGAGGIDLAESDLMLCGGLCDCNDDCPAEADFCMDENQGDATVSIMALFGRGGYCRPLIAERNETEADSIMCSPPQAGR